MKIHSLEWIFCTVIVYISSHFVGRFFENH